MELRVLRYFIAAAEEENLTRAAARLNMTQPSLSRQIAALERELGCALLARTKHGVELTANGRLFLARARDLVAMASRMEADFSPAGREIGGSLAVGTVETYAADVLPTLLASFLERAPRAHVDITCGNATEVIDRMEDGSLDVALLREPIDLERFETLPLATPDAWGVLVPSASPLAALPHASSHDLEDVRLIIPSRSALAREILSWFDDRATAPEPITYNALAAAVGLVRAGVGCAVCPSAVRASAVGDTTFVPLSPTRETSGRIAWRRGTALSPAAQAFIGTAQSALGTSDEADNHE